MSGISPKRTQSTPAASWRFNRRYFLLGSAACVAGLALYSNEIARHEIETTYRSFSIRRLPPAFNGFRIVQISDLHLHEYTEDFFVREVVARVNALSPDLVLLTGDFCSRGPFPQSYALAAARRCAELLAGLKAPQRFGILGNHDAIVGSRQVRSFLEDNGTPMLVNQFLPIERAGQHFWLAGLDDCLNGHPDIDITIPPGDSAAGGPDAPVLLMAHEPDFADRIVAHPRGRFVDLVLSGHTHGGQVRLPGLRPLLLPPEGQLYPEGHYQLGGTQLYVNRGIGTVGLPFRLNCPPEITVILLRSAPDLRNIAG